VGHLLALAAAVTVATFLVRLVLPFETDNRYVDLNMWCVRRRRDALGVVGHQLWGGWHWPAFLFAAGESTLSVLDRCGCSATRSDVSTGRFGGPAR
jgi:hypothetical protein